VSSAAPPVDSAGAVQTGQSAWGHHLPAAVVVAVGAGLVAVLTMAWGRPGLVLGVAVVQVALVVGWVATAGLEGPRASLGLGVAAAAGADLAMLLPARPQLGSLLAVLGVGFLAVVVQQMLRPRRDELVASLSGALLLICALCGPAALLLLGRSATERAVAVTAVLSVGGALVVGHVVDAVLPRPQLTPEVPCGLVALVLAVAAGAVVAVFRHGADTLADGLSSVIFGTVLGAVAALVSLAGSYVVADTLATDRPPPRWALPLVQALLPIAACGPVALALLSIL
jgi:hypothetical protein